VKGLIVTFKVAFLQIQSEDTMKTKQTAKPVRVQLQDCEWKFDNLPEDESELEACCRWEYARESKFIRDVTKLNAELRKGKMPTPAEQELLERLDSICESPFSSPDHFFKSPPFPQPWQSLDKAHKPFTMSKLPPVEYAFQTIDSRLPWRRFQRPNSAGRVISQSGAETLLVTIDWGGSTDNQIIESFERWIKNKHRPTGIGAANTKGKRVETRWQVMLDNLAIMRLLYHATLSEMPGKFPVAWKRYKSADWYRARKKANRNFHELFPFLTAKELPLSWSR